MHKNGRSLNSLKNFCLSADKIRRRTLLCFERILVSKLSKQRRGKLHGFVEIFFSSQDRKTVAREPFLWIRGWAGRYHNFPSKSFCLTVPKYFIGEHFGFSEKIFYRKFSSIGGGHHGFVEIFCVTGPKRKAL